MPSLQDILQSLSPTHKPNVMDLLRDVGHDVSHWGVNSDGSTVETPAANPNYCYDWSFGSATEGIVLSVWHEILRVEGDCIVYSEPMRTHSEHLYAIASDPKRNPKEKNRARQQATRARDFYGLVQLAYEQLLPVRLIINEGSIRSRSEFGSDTAKVALRKLDDESWYVHEYNEQTGEGLIVRGLKPARDQVDTTALEIGDDDRGPEDARQLKAIKIRRGQRDFRDRLLSAWSRRCVVTECRVDGLLEAAHIVPHAQETDYRTSNGLLFRADIHTLYDLLLLSIDEHMRIHLAPALSASEYKIYGGRQIRRRPDKYSEVPSVDALRKRHQKFLLAQSNSALQVDRDP